MEIDALLAALMDETSADETDNSPERLAKLDKLRKLASERRADGQTLADQFPYASNPCFADEPMDWAKVFTGAFSAEVQAFAMARRNGGAS